MAQFAYPHSPHHWTRRDRERRRATERFGSWAPVPREEPTVLPLAGN